MAMAKSEFNSYGCMIVNTGVELSLHDEEAKQKVKNSYAYTESLLKDLIISGQKTENNKEKLTNIIDINLSYLF